MAVSRHGVVTIDEGIQERGRSNGVDWLTSGQRKDAARRIAPRFAASIQQVIRHKVEFIC